MPSYLILQHSPTIIIIIPRCLRPPKTQYWTVPCHTLARRGASTAQPKYDSTPKHWIDGKFGMTRIPPYPQPSRSLGCCQFEATCTWKGRVRHYNEEVYRKLFSFSCFHINLLKKSSYLTRARRWHLSNMLPHAILLVVIRLLMPKRLRVRGGSGRLFIIGRGWEFQFLFFVWGFFRFSWRVCTDGRGLAAGWSAAAKAGANAALLAASLWRWDCWCHHGCKQFFVLLAVECVWSWKVGWRREQLFVEF